MKTAAVLLALLALPVAANAHAVLVSSTPKDKAVLKTAPKRVALRFDARIEKKVSQATLLTARGQKVTLTKPKGGYGGASNELIVPLPSLKPGSYRLEYRVLATDGHLTPGLVRFTISGGKSP